MILCKGMIELLILYLLSDKELTMYGVQKQITDIFGAFTRPSFGAVKPALTRLEEQGFIRSRKSMTDGGKLSGFYSVTTEGKKEFKRLILEDLSQNPLQFFSNCSIKIACANLLDKDERKTLFYQLKNQALKYKFDSENAISNNSLSFYPKIMTDNNAINMKNLVTLIENLEKEDK